MEFFKDLGVWYGYNWCYGKIKKVNKENQESKVEKKCLFKKFNKNDKMQENMYKILC